MSRNYFVASVGARIAGRVLVITGLLAPFLIGPATPGAATEPFSFAGIGLGSDLAEVARRYSRSTVVGSYIYVAPEEARDHVYGIEISGSGAVRRVRIAFGRSRTKGGPQYPDCAQVQAGIEARYGPPVSTRAFAEEMMRRSDRIWARPGESLTLVCFFTDDRRLVAEAVVIMPAAASAPATRPAGETGQDTELLPPIGARVRVLAPALGPGWHTGMLNRLRVEPPCYRILIFAPGQIRRVTATLSVRDLERLEAAAGRPFFDEHDSGKPSGESVEWREVPLEILHAAEQRCRLSRPRR